MLGSVTRFSTEKKQHGIGGGGLVAMGVHPRHGRFDGVEPFSRTGGQVRCDFLAENPGVEVVEGVEVVVERLTGDPGGACQCADRDL